MVKKMNDIERRFISPTMLIAASVVLLMLFATGSVTVMLLDEFLTRLQYDVLIRDFYEVAMMIGIGLITTLWVMVQEDYGEIN